MIKKEASVIIITKNGKETLKNLLEYLINLNNIEIILVDDFSNSIVTKKIINKYKNEILVFRNKKTKKQAISRNIGAKHSKSNILIFFDDDCIPLKNYFIKKHINFHKKNKQTVLLSNITARKEDSVSDSRFNRNKINFGLSKVNNSEIQSGSFSISKNIFLEAGGFDEKLSFFEDLDLGIRLDNMGIHAYKDNSLIINHLDEKLTIKNELLKNFNAYSKDFFYILKKHKNENLKSMFLWGFKFLNDRSIMTDLLYSRLMFNITYVIYKEFLVNLDLPKKLHDSLFFYLQRNIIKIAVNKEKIPILLK